MDDPLDPARPRRILHIGKYFPPHRGGMETVLRDQMNMQSRNEELQVAAVVHSSKARLLDVTQRTKEGYLVTYAARWFNFSFAPISPFFGLSLFLQIRKFRPDEIYVHLPNLSAFWLFLAPNSWRLKWVLRWHADYVASPHKIGLRVLYNLYSPLEQLLLKKCDVISCTSAAYLSSSKTLAQFRDKAIVQPIEIDTSRFPSSALPSSKTRPHTEPPHKILCVGRLAYYKDLAAAVELAFRIPSIHLRIVGDGEEFESLSSRIDNKSLNSRVKILRNEGDADLWRHYEWCHLHLLPSIERTEAFGVVILEAAMMSRVSLVRPIPGSGVADVAKKAGGIVAKDMSIQSLEQAVRDFFKI